MKKMVWYMDMYFHQFIRETIIKLLLEQMKQLSPVEIAELYHHDEFGEELDGTLKNMLTSIEQKLKEKEEE